MIIGIKFFHFVFFLFIGYYIFIYGYSNIQFPKNKKNLFETKDINKDDKDSFSLDISEDKNEIINNISELDHTKKTEIIVEKNQTFSSILNKFFLDKKLIFEIINKVNEKFDLRKLKIGQKIIFIRNNKNIIENILIEKSFKKNIKINLSDKIIVEEEILQSTYENVAKEIIINNSLYLDGIKNNIPASILIKLIKLYSFDLDFQRDIRQNTKLSVFYDLIYVEGKEELLFGDINYALITIGKNNFEYFKFKTNDGYIDYFNREGKNVKKSILKTPIDGAKLSSNFGMRKHPILGYNKMHKGIDFAAPTGTPIYAGGDGIIEFAGNNGAYGKYIRIRHVNGYKTAYAHLSKFANNIYKGFRVNQGDTIGFVGSTGRSTGPHLHYEILFNNEQINPLKLKLPSGKVLKDEELKRFKKHYKEVYANFLNSIFE